MPRSIEMSDSYMVNQSKRTHGNPIEAIAKEQVSNGISHTPDGIQPWQRIELVHGDRSSISCQYMMHSCNSEATRFLCKEDPFNGEKMARMLDVGHDAEYKVKEHSRFNTGNNNTDFAFGPDCHTERFTYDSRSRIGAAVMYTRPKYVDANETRAMSESTKHLVYYMGFQVNIHESGFSVKMFAGAYPPEDVMEFLLHSRLTGDGSDTMFCPTHCAKVLSEWILKNVTAIAHDENVPGDTSFVCVTDTSNVKYMDPTTNSARYCFSESGCGDILYRRTVEDANSGFKVVSTSLRTTIRREYLLPDVPEVKAWKCANGAGITDLKNFDVGIVNSCVSVDTADTHENTAFTFDEEARMAMERSKLMKHFKVDLEATEDDLVSLGITHRPKNVTVDVYAFVVPPKLKGVATMWRNKMNRIKPDALQKLRSVPLSENTFYGMNGRNKQREAFNMNCEQMGFQIELHTPANQTHAPQYYMSEKGVRDFKECFKKDPAIVFHDWEKFAESADKSGKSGKDEKANTRRKYMYGDNVLFLLQLGNLCPDYNKDGCTESEARWTFILNEMCRKRAAMLISTYSKSVRLTDAELAEYSVKQKSSLASRKTSSTWPTIEFAAPLDEGNASGEGGASGAGSYSGEGGSLPMSLGWSRLCKSG